MAFVGDFTCSKCQQPRHEVVTHDHVCADCRKKEADRARRIHFASLKGLTVEERLERIERELYETAAKRRLDALEAQNARY